jgi:hypothetical protein
VGEHTKRGNKRKRLFGLGERAKDTGPHSARKEAQEAVGQRAVRSLSEDEGESREGINGDGWRD